MLLLSFSCLSGREEGRARKRLEEKKGFFSNLCVKSSLSFALFPPPPPRRAASPLACMFFKKKNRSDRKVGLEIGAGRFRGSGLLVDLGRPRRRAKRKNYFHIFLFSASPLLFSHFLSNIFCFSGFLCYNNGSRSRNGVKIVT